MTLVEDMRWEWTPSGSVHAYLSCKYSGSTSFEELFLQRANTCCSLQKDELQRENLELHTLSELR